MSDDCPDRCLCRLRFAIEEPGACQTNAGLHILGAHHQRLLISLDGIGHFCGAELGVGHGSEQTPLSRCVLKLDVGKVGQHALELTAADARPG